LMLGRLEAALAMVQGLEHKAFGVTEEDQRALEPKLQSITAAVLDTIHTVLQMLPEGEPPGSRGN